MRTVQQGKDATVFVTVQELADKIGVKLDVFRKRNQELRPRGTCRVDAELLVTIPADDFVVKEQSIAEEESPSVKRKPTGLSQDDRKTLIKESWNKYKPDWCAPLSGNIAPPLYFAIEAQTKHLEHDRDDYDGFMKRICAALAESRFWRDEATSPSRLTEYFGWGIP